VKAVLQFPASSLPSPCPTVSGFSPNTEELAHDNAGEDCQLHLGFAASLVTRPAAICPVDPLGTLEIAEEITGMAGGLRKRNLYQQQKKILKIHHGELRF
jgi:hypothetical protein